MVYFFYKTKCVTQEDPLILLKAFRGTAAFNILGTTLNSAFQLGTHVSTLSDEKTLILHTKLHAWQLIVIDECSMVSSQIMAVINDCCLKIKQTNPSDQTFGNVSVLAREISINFLL